MCLDDEIPPIVHVIQTESNMCDIVFTSQDWPIFTLLFAQMLEKVVLCQIVCKHFQHL